MIKRQNLQQVNERKLYNIWISVDGTDVKIGLRILTGYENNDETLLRSFL